MSQVVRDVLTVKSECLVVAKGINVNQSPCVILLKAFKLVPLLSQRGLQIQIGAIVGELQCAVIKLWKRIKKSFLIQQT